MAQTLLQKARIAVLANLHGLLDKAVDTPEGYRQYIRDLESAIAELQGAVDENAGTVTGYQRDAERLQAEIAKKQADIDQLLGDDDPSNDNAAVQLQMDLETDSTQLELVKQNIVDTTATKTELDSAVAQLNTRHQQMVNELAKLTTMHAASQAKNRAASAAEAASQASTAAAGASVDSLEANLAHQKDVADARFARVIGGMQSTATPEDAAALSRAKAALEARRAEIAAHAAKA